MSDDSEFVKGHLFIGDSTYIEGEWVRRRDYEAVQDLRNALRDEVTRLREEVHLLHQRLREGYPPHVEAVIERHDGMDIARQITGTPRGRGPNGIIVYIAP